MKTVIRLLSLFLLMSLVESTMAQNRVFEKYYREGIALLKKGECEKARQKFKSALSSNPTVNERSDVLGKIRECDECMSKKSTPNRPGNNNRPNNNASKTPNEVSSRAQEKERARQNAIEDSLYQLCTTVQSCNNYLYRFPDGRYADEVNEKRRALNARQSEKQAYEECKTIQDCDNFLSTYPDPNGEYYSIVWEMKEKMEIVENEAARTAYMDIKKIEFANTTGGSDGGIIDKYGSTLYASDVKYITPRITYNSILDEVKSVSIKYKIINPSGIVECDNAGYTSSYEFEVVPGRSKTIELISGECGNQEGGTFASGEYRFELWYQDQLIYTTMFTLKDRENDLSRGRWREILTQCIINDPMSDGQGKYRGNKSNDGQYSGKGMYVYANGDIYIGNWISGKRNGMGVYLSKNGNIKNCPNCYYYVGRWYQDKKEGRGSCYDRVGKMIYDGNFENDVPTEKDNFLKGYSKYKFECIETEEGDFYVGETENGTANGKGVEIYTNGDIKYRNYENGKAAQKIDLSIKCNGKIG